MDKVLNLYKRCGETPLECILRFKKDNPEYEGVSMTYAGRLDPLAEGVLLVLAGEAVHRKEEFLNLKKEYEVEVLFGVGTDTYDVLGIVTTEVDLSSLRMRGSTLELKSQIRSTKFETNSKFKIQNIKQELTNSAITEFVNSDNTSLWRNNAEDVLKNFIGKNVFEYPSYSSKPVNGKPLFSIARSGGLDDIEMPKREVEIYGLKIVGWREINSKDLLKDIEKKISEVQGDFRQEITLSKWKEVLDNIDCNFQIAKIRAEVSSGTYMRTLAYEWGKSLGEKALAYHIIRTSVGYFGINNK